MLQITFKAKPDGNTITIPAAFTRKHVNMNQARQHPVLGAYANSDLFPAMLARCHKELVPSGRKLVIDPSVALPKWVEEVRKGGLLWTVTLDADKCLRLQESPEWPGLDVWRTPTGLYAVSYCGSPPATALHRTIASAYSELLAVEGQK